MPRQGLGHSSIDIYNMVTPGTDDPVWKHPTSGQLMVGYQETRTNNVLHSQDVTDTEAWTKQNTAIDSTLYEAPDNSTTANAVKSNGTGEQLYTVSQSISVTAGKTYTASVHLKKENLTFVQLRFADGDGLPRAVFNLTTGAVTNAVNVIAAQADAMDDDWYRCSITFVATTSSGSIKPFAQLADNDGTPNVAVSGIVLIYVWGFQLEENSEMSTYIPTTSSARTITTPLNDTSEIWDFDGADLMPEEKPSDDGAWEVSSNLVLNHDYADLGSELVTNGDFSAGSTGWENAFGSEWVISGGKATIAVGADGSYLRTVSNILTSGKSYKAVITTSGGLDSNNKVTIYAESNTGQKAESDGTHTFYFTANGTSFRLRGVANDRPISIDSVSVKQVDPNDRWILGTGVTIEDGKLKINGGALQGAEQSNVITSGTPCSVTFTVSNYVSGTVNLRHPLSQEVSANGTYTFTGDANSTKVLIRGNAVSNEFTIDNVTVREYAVQPKDI